MLFRSEHIFSAVLVHWMSQIRRNGTPSEQLQNMIIYKCGMTALEGVYMSKNYVRKIVFAGIVAALYASMTLIIAPIAYGPIQLRLTEVLCILPFFYPITALGLFVGCFIANLFSPYVLDMIFGPIASLIAALVTMQLGRVNRESISIKALACFPPVIFNAVIIGAVIAWSMVGSGEAFLPAFVINGLQVGLGQLIVMYAAGLPLMMYLPKLQVFSLLTKQYNI